MRRVIPLAARRILSIALILAPAAALVTVAHSACAQNNPPAIYGHSQSPVNILDDHVEIDWHLPAFTNTGDLSQARNFLLKNNIGAHWCGSCAGLVDGRWGTLKAYPDPKGSGAHITYGGQGYTLEEFHFHLPAEHIVDNRIAAMELHIVFSKDNAVSCSAGSFLVIGQRIALGEPNAELEKIFGPNVMLPTSYSSNPTPLGSFTIGKLLGALEFSYRYDGSLTAPNDLGCNPPGNPDKQLATGVLPEVVSWALLEGSTHMSAAQIARFQGLFPGGNARAPQPLYQQVKRPPRVNKKSADN
jgi:carbonic anhydrase